MPTRIGVALDSARKAFGNHPAIADRSRQNVPDFIKTYPDNKVFRVYSDHLGSPRMLYDTTGAGSVFKTFDFDEFGIKTETGPDFEYVFGFAGGQYDSDTQLTRFGARDYDARIGRWVSKDPILFGGRQANLYVYVNNDPVNRVNPSGLEDGAGGTSGFGEGGAEGGPSSSPDDPEAVACGNEFANCWSDCMEAQGADYAAGVFVGLSPFAPTPKTAWEMGRTMGGGATMTTWASRASAALGMSAGNWLRTAGAGAAKLSGLPYAGAGGYLAGSGAICTMECS